MTVLHGLHWPDRIRATAPDHALMHLSQSLEVSIARCRKQKRTRTAIQAGGNVGLWPRRMAEVFTRVVTFEPDAISRECLIANVPASVEVRPEALGAEARWCDITHKGLGSHKIVDGASVRMVRLDDLEIPDVDLIQLDVEGYEWPALRGASDTLARCRPIVHVELRDDLSNRTGRTADVVAWLRAHGYRQVATAPGSDVIFEAGA